MTTADERHRCHQVVVDAAADDVGTRLPFALTVSDDPHTFGCTGVVAGDIVHYATLVNVNMLKVIELIEFYIELGTFLYTRLSVAPRFFYGVS